MIAAVAIALAVLVVTNVALVWATLRLERHVHAINEARGPVVRTEARATVTFRPQPLPVAAAN